MLTALPIVFVIGYLLITLEEVVHLNKTATALFLGVVCWILYALSAGDASGVSAALADHLNQIAQIVFFLLGAMAIVELIDAHQGFQAVTHAVKTRQVRQLVWTVSLLTFFLSAILDNLTASIVMVTVCRHLVINRPLRQMIAGFIIIAANAGGAWSPLGDVTTTMLWIGGQLTAVNVIQSLIIPSLVALLVPLGIWSLRPRGKLENKPAPALATTRDSTAFQRNTMLVVGIAMFVMVPVLKQLTQLPPFMGMLLALSVVWVTSELLNHRKDEEERKRSSAAYALRKIDTSSLLFFVGILLAVGALEATHMLSGVAVWLNETVGNMDVTVLLIGTASAVVDNVPLVAAAMGMYDLQLFPANHRLWELLAFCAGTGGSLLVIGSAAGVAVMGMERLTFFGYIRQTGWLALLGYGAGALSYLALNA